MSVADTDRSSYILCEQKDDLHEHGRARIATLQRTMSEGMVNAKSIWLVGRSQTRSPRAAQRVGRSNGKRLYQQKHERKSLKKKIAPRERQISFSFQTLMEISWDYDDDCLIKARRAVIVTLYLSRALATFLDETILAPDAANVRITTVSC